MRAYPLAAIRAVREREETAARVVSARALAEEERALAVRDGAARAVLEWSERIASATTSPAGDRACAGQLGERAAFAARLRREAVRKESALRLAEAELRQAAGASERRVAALAEARAAVRALELHEGRWRAERLRRRGRREEDAAEDFFNAGRAAR